MSDPVTHYYVDVWTQDRAPCAPTLQGWADWLSRTDAYWGHDTPASDGDEFGGSSLEVLGDVRVEWVEGAWAAVEPIPEGATRFIRRPHEGATSWLHTVTGATIAEAADRIDESAGPLWFACVRDGEPFVLRFNLTADGPRLTVVED